MNGTAPSIHAGRGLARRGLASLLAGLLAGLPRLLPLSTSAPIAVELALARRQRTPVAAA